MVIKDIKVSFSGDCRIHKIPSMTSASGSSPWKESGNPKEKCSPILAEIDGIKTSELEVSYWIHSMFFLFFAARKTSLFGQWPMAHV